MNPWRSMNPWRCMNLWRFMNYCRFMDLSRFMNSSKLTNLWRFNSRFVSLIAEDSYEWISTKGFMKLETSQRGLKDIVLSTFSDKCYRGGGVRGRMENNWEMKLPAIVPWAACRALTCCSMISASRCIPICLKKMHTQRSVRYASGPIVVSPRSTYL